MTSGIQSEIASLKRGIVHAESACIELIETYGHGVRPSFVSEDLSYYGERAERYRREIARLEAAEHE
jgi:hypothetical protein